jgi:isopenicillin N synthase-like dioxygenase
MNGLENGHLAGLAIDDGQSHNDSRVSPDIYKASSVAEIRATLAHLNEREASVTARLNSLIASQKDLSESSVVLIYSEPTSAPRLLRQGPSAMACSQMLQQQQTEYLVLSKIRS